MLTTWLTLSSLVDNYTIWYTVKVHKSLILSLNKKILGIKDTAKDS